VRGGILQSLVPPVERTILLVDDEANLRTLVRTTLDDASCRIIEASGGAAALELARTEAPDLILLDWMMPGMSGLDVLKALRGNAATAGTPVIMLTAKGQQKDKEQILSLGACSYLVKPFSPLELLGKVEDVLQLPRAAAEIELELQKADSQLALYARDLKRAVDAERMKSRELEKANARLEILDRLKTDFLAFISHELRTPLTAMTAIRLFDSKSIPAEQAELIEIIQHGYDRLHDFIKKGLEYFGWLSLERIDTEDVLDLAALVQRVTGRMPSLASPHAQCTVLCPPVPCLVRGEEKHFEQLLEILIANALKFSPRQKEIAIEVSQRGGQVILSVSDRGIGLQSEMVEEIFRPFTVADTGHHGGGSGLNLAIARVLVKAHGGAIRAESKGPGMGTEFIVELPAATARGGE
jgi:signal transduction histidine kinase